MVFQTKKIQSETLSEYLLLVRESLHFTIDTVSSETGIQKKYIVLIEKGSFSELPAEVYVCGFLKKLAALYSIDEEPLIAQYKKERGIVANISGKPLVSNKSKYSLLAITPKTLSFAVALLFLIGTFTYVVFQIRGMSQDPTITVLEPASGSKLTDSFVKIIGQTEPGNQLSINSEDVFVTEQGNFTAMVSVSPGQVELVFTATNKFNKKTIKTLALIRDEAVQASEQQQQLHTSLTSGSNYSN